jgi:hypothetical protein
LKPKLDANTYQLKINFLNGVIKRELIKKNILLYFIYSTGWSSLTSSKRAFIFFQVRAGWAQSPIVESSLVAERD